MSQVQGRCVSSYSDAESKRTRQARTQAENTMSTPLAVVVRSERREYQKQSEGNLLFYWERGRVIHHVQTNKSLNGEKSVDYGKEPLRQMGDALGISTSALSRMLGFFHMYKEAEVRDLIERAKQKEVNLSFGHIQEVLPVPNEKNDVHRHRKNLIELVLTEGLSIRALREEVYARFPQLRTASLSTDKKSAKASSILCRRTEQYLEAIDGGISLLFTSIGERTDAPYSEQTVKELKDVQQQFAGAAQRLQEAADRVQSVISSSTRPNPTARSRRAAPAAV